jgi:hypothetical protein
MAEDALSFNKPEDVIARIAKELAESPLYQQVEYSDSSQTRLKPETISLFCSRCDKETTWETYAYPGTNYRNGFGDSQYTCRNCREARIQYYYYWGDGDGGRIIFFKFGQWPAMEERIPNELRKNLDRSSLALYYRSLRCRNQGLGLGSLAYLRRVVEDKINLVLDMIAEEAGNIGFAAEDIAKVKDVKDRGLFKDKIALASAILPPSLRPGGHNPIDALHDLVSDGVHRRSEDECVEIFDRVRFVFEYLFSEIDTRRRSAEEYAASVAKLASQRRMTAS